MLKNNNTDRFWLDHISPVLHQPAYHGKGNTPVGWIEPMRVIYNHQLVLISSGEITVKIEDQEFVCQEPSFIIIPPGKKHISRNSSSATCIRHWVHFDWIHQGDLIGIPPFSYIPGKVIEKHFHNAPDFVPKQILHGIISSPAYILELHERICRRLESPTQHERFNCRGLLLELLTALLYPGTNDSSSPDERFAVRVKEKLDEMAFANKQETPGIQDALKSLGRSYAHLCRLFHKTYGIPPLIYFNSLRIEKAKFLLQSTDLSIAEIADMTGFATAAYFSRKFRKQTNLPPRDFRIKSSP